MSEQMISIFDGMERMLEKLKKPSYEKNMQEFQRFHGHFFSKMLDHIEGHEEKEKAALEAAGQFVRMVEEGFTINGKIKATVQADLNLFMIYYVFPAILLTDHQDAELLAGTICKIWGSTFKKSKIGYTSYEKLYSSFSDKILGIF